MELKRKIRLFFVAYGRLLFEIIGIILLVILVLQWINKQAIEQQNVTSSNETNYEEEIMQKEKDKQNEDKRYISAFIDCCKDRKIEEAYSMLSESCKQEKYRSIESFENDYLNKVFSIKIYDYTISKNNGNIYLVELKEDLLNTGGIETIKEIKYNITEEILERKINIID